MANNPYYSPYILLQSPNGYFIPVFFTSKISPSKISPRDHARFKAQMWKMLRQWWVVLGQKALLWWRGVFSPGSRPVVRFKAGHIDIERLRILHKKGEFVCCLSKKMITEFTNFGWKIFVACWGFGKQKKECWMLSFLQIEFVLEYFSKRCE